APTSKAGAAGIFLRIMATTIAGTRKRSGLRLNDASIAVRITLGSRATSVVSSVNPHTMKIISAITSDGTVVYSMYCTWVKRLVPAIAGARFVVSDSGDILSPK